MALYKADVWLGSNSGRQTVNVSANTIAGAKEQIRTIYNVSDTAIWNLHEAPRERAGGGVSDDGGDASFWGGAALVGLMIVAWVVASFTPQVFGVGGGSATWWVLCRLQGKSFDDLLLPTNRRALLITMALTTAAGVGASLVGRQVQLEHFTEAQPVAQDVRPADPAGASGPTQARPQQGTQPARVPPAAGDL